jgi:hypothetical protein
MFVGHLAVGLAAKRAAPAVNLGCWNRHLSSRQAAPRMAIARRFWSLVIASTLMWASSPWTTPPPSPRALGWFALIGWLVIPWAALADASKRRAPAI